MTDRPGEGYVDRYSQGVKALLGAVSGEPIVEHSPELIFDINLESGNPEFAYLLGITIWSSSPLTSAGVVAKTSQVDALNPAGSGVIDVITRIRILNPVAGSNYILVFPSGQASGGVNAPGNPLDGRSARPAIQFSTGAPVNGGIVPQVNLHIGSVQATDLELNEPIVLKPGQRATVFNNTANQVLNVIMFGYERAVNLSELKTIS